MQFEILEGDVVVTLDGNGSGSIASTLKEPPLDDDDGSYEEYSAAIDGVESLILAHACAGVDITDRRYQLGIQTAVEAIGNNF